jgi:hypothetical protein
MCKWRYDDEHAAEYVGRAIKKQERMKPNMAAIIRVERGVGDIEQ